MRRGWQDYCMFTQLPRSHNIYFHTSIFFFSLTLLKRKHRLYNSGLTFTVQAKSLILRGFLFS